MSEKRKISCDCGCRKKVSDYEAGGWFALTQNEPLPDDDIKLNDGKLHFASIECIAKWAAKAVAVAPQLRESAEEHTCHGEISSPKAPGIHT